MSHFGEKINPPYSVFHVVLEIVVCIIFSSHCGRALTEICIFRLRHKSALKFKNSQSYRETIHITQKPAKFSFLNEPVSYTIEFETDSPGILSN